MEEYEMRGVPKKKKKGLTYRSLNGHVIDGEVKAVLGISVALFVVMLCMIAVLGYFVVVAIPALKNLTSTEGNINGAINTVKTLKQELYEKTDNITSTLLSFRQSMISDINDTYAILESGRDNTNGILSNITKSVSFIYDYLRNHVSYEPLFQNVNSPGVYNVTFKLSTGFFTLSINKSLAPIASDRFKTLVDNGFFSDSPMFRVDSGFVVQWGLSRSVDQNLYWHERPIDDEPVIGSNTYGTIAFASGFSDDERSTNRTSQVYINLGDNNHLDEYGFAPFGVVVEGMEAILELYGGYGNGPTYDQGNLMQYGNHYAYETYPFLDTCVIASSKWLYPGVMSVTEDGPERKKRKIKSSQTFPTQTLKRGVVSETILHSYLPPFDNAKYYYMNHLLPITKVS